MGKLPNIFFNVIFPEKCLICGENISFVSHEYPHFCDSCLKDFKEIRQEEKRCKKCGIPMGNNEYTDVNLQLCRRCERERYSFEYNVSLYSYKDQLVKKIFYLYKFSNRKQIAYLFAKKVGRFIKKRFSLLPVVPVPSRKGKLRKLGWDHVEFIAKIMSKEYGISVYPLLRRIKSVKPQKELDSNARKKNVEGVFSINKKGIEKFFQGKFSQNEKMEDIVLLDDVFTTGATAEACSRVLKNAGFRKIFVVTIAID